ncbi:MAG: sugar phosphate isomerase/epimerase family protein [Actinomycetes bacterium]
MSDLGVRGGGRGLLDRVAGAPISWGVCEVPGWGHQMDAGSVLGEMRALGLAATELGPAGFLPGGPAEQAGLLASYGLRAVGGFVPLVLHDPGADPLPTLDDTLRSLVAAHADTVVLAAATGLDGYDTRPVLDDVGWAVLLANLYRCVDSAVEHGLAATLHPHVGTMVETRDDVRRVLDSSDVPFCLDTGHLLVGGTDPVEVTADAASRVTHTHLKDVDAALAARVRAGEVSYAAAVRHGLYRPLGQGDVDVARILRALEGAGYTGWYVLEQDCVLDGPPPGGLDTGPAGDVRASVDFLADVAGGVAG